ncbi:uncharacterized protein PAF06_017696 [Gastrophryne carolinensis]
MQPWLSHELLDRETSDVQGEGDHKPRLEHFPMMEKDGDLDIFLRGFEKVCRQFHLPKEQWGRYLTPRLRGKATRRCYRCNKIGHLSATCPNKKNSPPAVEGHPAVFLVSGTVEKRVDNLQSVTVGDRVTVGLRDSGASFTLVRPEVVDTEDIIPGKTMALKGIGGVRPAVPMARVYLDWGAGKGLREVGVSEDIPVNVLLGNDLETGQGGRFVPIWRPSRCRYSQLPAIPTAAFPESGDSGNSAEGRAGVSCVKLKQNQEHQAGTEGDLESNSEFKLTVTERASVE